MSEIADFGSIVLAVSATVFVALLAMRLADRLALPYAAVILVGAVVISEIFPQLQDVLSTQHIERLAVVALVIILFDGGLHIGARRFRESAAPILALGVIGTFATAALVAVAAHYLLGFDWILAGLVGAAVAPTDPAVTFSLFGSREIKGRSGTILEGEAGMNDPVGIALMVGMIELATTDNGDLGIIAREFGVEMAVGLGVGVACAWGFLPIARRLRLTGPALHPIRFLAAAGMIYGLASIMGGSGFLAVFVAGIFLGDAAAPRKGEVEGFLSSLAGLAEIAVFVALGLSVGLGDLSEGGTWTDGLAIALFLAFVARPLATLPLLAPARLTWNERVFIAWGGLKGAVPILLGTLAVLAQVDDDTRLYGIVFIVVLFSVVVQGASVPLVADRLRIPFRRVDHDLSEVVDFVVRDDAFANGRRLADLPLGKRAWVDVLVREGRPHVISDDVVLQPGDHVHVYCQPEDVAALDRIFAGPHA